jgi:hypothetical protein
LLGDATKACPASVSARAMSATAESAIPLITRAESNPPRGTVLLLSSSADHFSDLRVHSYERSYDGIWSTGGGFDGTGAATPVERRSEAGDSRGIGTRGIIWGCGCAAVRDLDGSSVHMAPTGSRVAGALSTKGTWLHAGVGRAGG